MKVIVNRDSSWWKAQEANRAGSACCSRSDTANGAAQDLTSIFLDCSRPRCGGFGDDLAPIAVLREWSRRGGCSSGSVEKLPLELPANDA